MGDQPHKADQNFYESLAKGEKPQIDGDEAIKTQKMVCAIYESGRTGKRIQF